ncbi:DUF7882 family protein [Leifsonia sp. 2MCAF36]|uniref:DUF7882 family protein n=1 Tax=Leifsonia sp. 2MCAF36 TaxID=3232988 RepID=UPI003F9E0CD5
MGSLFYGASRLEIVVDDATLALLQRVIVAKMRRGEPFAITWDDDDSIGDGLSSVWISPTIELHFKFDSGRLPALDPAELERMSMESATPSGLRLRNATLIAEPTGYDS